MLAKLSSLTALKSKNNRLHHFGKKKRQLFASYSKSFIIPSGNFKNVVKSAHYKLVGGAITILKNMSSSMGRIIPYIMENKTCVKPPASKCGKYTYVIKLNGPCSSIFHSSVRLPEAIPAR